MARVRLPGGARSPEQIAANDRGAARDVWPVVAVLLVYCWCFTGLAGALGLPTPGEVLGGVELPRVIDADGGVQAKLRVSFTERWNEGDELLIVFGSLLGCFLSVYFVPLRWKARAAVAWFVPTFAALYGGWAAAVLVGAHAAIWAAFHRLRDGGVARVVRGLLVHGCMLTLVVACAYEGVTGAMWKLPVGLVFFFYQWARLMVYAADFSDGQVPRALPLAEYLALFLTPVNLCNVGWAPYLGQGYAYLQARRLSERKDVLVRSGVRLWLLALVYMVFAEQVIAWFIAAMGAAGVTVYAFTGELVREYLKRETEVSTPTVLLTTLVDQARIFLIYGGVTHFRVGAWRVMGYAVDTQYDRPWLATNLANLWGRFAFHFREFLVRVFYYPVFLRVFRRRALLRIFFATMVATVVGNLIWGHVPPRTIVRPTWHALVTILSTWPYFALLGLGISLTQIHLARRPRTRRPWTRDRWLWLDVVCAYLTLQYFALIHIFIRPQDGGTLADYAALVLIGLGIRVG